MPSLPTATLLALSVPSAAVVAVTMTCAPATKHAGVAGLESDDWRGRRHHHALLAALVAQRERASAVAHNVSDGAVGHRAVRLQVERAVTFAGATPAWRKHVDLQRLQRTVRLRYRCGADVAAWRNVGNLVGRDQGDRGVGPQHDGHLAAAARRYLQRLTVHLIDCAAYTRRRGGLRQGCVTGQSGEEDQQDAPCDRHVVSLRWLAADPRWNGRW